MAGNMLGSGAAANLSGPKIAEPIESLRKNTAHLEGNVNRLRRILNRVRYGSEEMPESAGDATARPQQVGLVGVLQDIASDQSNELDTLSNLIQELSEII